MIGVGLVGFVTIFAASAKASIAHVIDTSIESRLHREHVGIQRRPAAARSSRSSPQVAGRADRERAARSARCRSTSRSSRSQGVDPTVVDELFDLGVLAGAACPISATTASPSTRRRPKSHHLKLGSTLPVRFTKTGRAGRSRCGRSTRSRRWPGKYVISIGGLRRQLRQDHRRAS